MTTTYPTQHWQALADAAQGTRDRTVALERITVGTVPHFGAGPQIRAGDILADSGQTVTAVFDGVWDAERKTYDGNLPFDFGHGVVVATEGGPVHGLTALTGRVEVFRPTLKEG